MRCPVRKRSEKETKSIDPCSTPGFYGGRARTEILHEVVLSQVDMPAAIRTDMIDARGSQRGQHAKHAWKESRLLAWWGDRRVAS